MTRKLAHVAGDSVSVLEEFVISAKSAVHCAVSFPARLGGYRNCAASAARGIIRAT